ncbi:EamA family transporter [Salsuginibacillus kocurii]|uniref:EamA family transporter n=1 Tax=Salsuginibacillus kocurii TaxID=427078 RepID=UPI00036AD741|nr:EamA family transporter [Salsuginibacillus kocurii]
MSWFLIALCSSVVFGLGAFFMKYASFREVLLGPYFFGVYLSGTAGFVVVAAWEHSLTVTWPLLVSGLVVGVGSTFGNLIFMKAMKYGPASLTSPFVNTNILLIVLMGVFVYSEVLYARELIGITLIIAAVMILPLDSKEDTSITNRVWYLLTTVAMLLFFFRNGGLKVTEELGLANTPVLMYGYLFGAIWSGYYWWNQSRSMEKEAAGSETKSSERLVAIQKRLTLTQTVLFGLFTGIFSFGGMQLYALALLDGPVSIVSPIFASHSLIVAFLSIYWLKEKITLLQAVTLIFVIAGIILLQI